MIIYDKAKWHYGAKNAPNDITQENGATHIAFFVRWCIENSLYSKQLKQDFSNEVTAIEDKNSDMDCRAFFLNNLDGVFCSDELNTKGKSFAKAYYTSEKTKFAKQHGWYLEDYNGFVQKVYGDKNFDNAYFYIEYNEENYQKIKQIIDKNYQLFLALQESKGN